MQEGLFEALIMKLRPKERASASEVGGAEARGVFGLVEKLRARAF